MKNIAIYYRVSTDRQGLDSQKHEINQWLGSFTEEKKPKTIVEYSDEGISGSDDDRPQFKTMLSQAFARKIDTIVVFKLDRFSRNATTAIRLLLDLDQIGCAFISITQPVLNLSHDNPFRRTMLAAFAEIAELERTTTVSRIHAGLAAARKRGVRLGPPIKITTSTKDQIRSLRLQGTKLRAISKLLGISLGSICKVLKEKL